MFNVVLCIYLYLSNMWKGLQLRMDNWKSLVTMGLESKEKKDLEFDDMLLF